MNIVDANVVLRYLLNDVEELVARAAHILESKVVYIPNEVLAEVVYVLEKVYRIERTEICSSLLTLIEYDTVQVQDKRMILMALEQYAARRLDFIDTILYAYNKVLHYTVYTFDDKLNRTLQQK